jgi:hypothetical protein
VKGRLCSDFTVYDSLPAGEFKKWNYTDAADKGTDFVCSVDYIEDGTDVYITDVFMSDDIMETTEPAVAELLDADEVDEAAIECKQRRIGFCP